MSIKEQRRIWLVTKDGVPQHCAWAMVKTLAETSNGSHDAALGAAESEVDGWDATPTQWRTVPQVLRPGVIENGTPEVSSRDVIVAGLKYNLDTGGRVKPGVDVEPYEPDAEVVDETALLEASEAAELEIKFVEKTTLKSFRASPAEDAELAGEDALIHRVGVDKTRTNKA
jgi:hypothetical protein